MANKVVKITFLAALVAFILWIISQMKSVSDPFDVED